MPVARRVVVTGVNGFVGRHLARHLAESGDTVVGIAHDGAPAGDVADVLAEFRSADLTAGWPEIEAVDAIVHLAGLSAVGPSFDDPQRYLEINSAMVTHLGEALLATGRSPRVVVVSSGAVYASDQDLPLTEDSRVHLGSPYVVSKLLVESQASYYRHRGLDLVVARPFNHIGPGQGPGFLVPDLHAALVRHRADATPLSVGNLKTARDYTDVRDVVRAYRLLITTDRLDHDVYNICSGTASTGRQILDALADAVGVTDVETVVDPVRIRPGDPAELRGSADRLRDATGWAPTLDPIRSITDFVAASR